MEPNLAWLATNFVASLLLPPFSLILLVMAGLVLLKQRPRLGKNLIAAGLALLYALSTPLVATFLFRLLQSEPLPEKPNLSGVGAIVVLGSGRYEDAPEYGGDTNSSLGLERLRYAAHLHRKTGLPVLAAGGSPEGRVPEARFMKETLEKEFGVPVRWTEEGSHNTRENALLSRRILAAEGIDKILLVTHAWHMPRAQHVFEKAGFSVIPAGTRFSGPVEPRLFDFIPDAGALRSSAYALHELIGIVWYRLRD
jgi:uncharacterized SAM-binding protein YcdF (DUF218 family)